MGAKFLSTHTVKQELKDFRSKMNLDIMIQSKRIQLHFPSLKSIIQVKNMLHTIDPNQTLSQTDIEVLTLAWEKKGTIVTNDFKLQMDIKIQNKKYVIPAKAAIQRFIGYTGLNDLLDTRLFQASCLSPFGPHFVRSNMLQGYLSADMT